MKKIFPDPIKIRAIRDAPPLIHIIRAISKQLDSITETALLDMVLSKSRPQLQMRTLNALKNYAVLRYVTIIEIFFLVLTKEFYDKKHFDLTKFFDDIKISPQSENSIRKNRMKFKKSEIISSNFNFQNLAVIDSVMSQITGVKFLETMEKYLQTPTEPTAKEPYAKYTLRNNWNDFKEIFVDRNRISHSIKEIPLASAHVRVLGHAVETFLIFSLSMAVTAKDLRAQRMAHSVYENTFNSEFEENMRPYY